MSCAPTSKPSRPRVGRATLRPNALDEALALPTDFSARIARDARFSSSRRPGRRGSSTVGRQLLCRAAHYSLAKKASDHIQEVRAIGGMATPPSTPACRKSARRGVSRTRPASTAASSDRGRQQVPARGRSADRSAEGRQLGCAREADREARPAEGRTRPEGRRGGARGADKGGGGWSRQSSRAFREGGARRRRRSAKSPRLWKRSMAATGPKPAPYQGFTARRSGRWTIRCGASSRCAKPSRRTMGGAPASSSPRSARMGMTADEKVIASAFADLGFDADIGALSQRRPAPRGGQTQRPRRRRVLARRGPPHACSELRQELEKRRPGHSRRGRGRDPARRLRRAL